MHPANQRLRKPDKLSQGVHNQTSYPRVQWENTLDKRGTTEPPRRRRLPRKPKRKSPVNNNRGEHKVKEQEQEHSTTHAAGN